MSALVAVDGSAGSTAAIEFLHSFGDSAFASLETFSVEPLIVINAAADPAIPAVEVQPSEAFAAKTAKEAAKQVAGCAKSIASSHDLGRPATLIVDKARSLGSVLVVLGAAGHGALERFFLGSVSYEVATSAPCSVLVVRPK